MLRGAGEVGVISGTALRLLLPQAKWPVALAFLLAGLALAWGELGPPRYEAVTRVAVSPVRPADLGQTQAIREVMNSYMQDIPTIDMAVAAAERLASDPRCRVYDRDPGRLLGRLRVSSDLNVYEIQVKARSTNAEEALCISEKWSAAFVERREAANLQLDPLDRIVTATRDQTAVHRIWPRRRLLTLGGGLAGAFLGTALALLVTFAATGVVRRASDVTDCGWRLLGLLPQEQSRPELARPSGSPRTTWLPNVGRWLRAGSPLLWLVLLGGGTGYALSAMQPTIWRARTRIAVEPARGSDWGQTQAIREIMKGYSEDIRTRRMAERVNALAEADEQVDQLLERLNVAPKEGVYEIVVDVRHPDRETAQQLSRIWATAFVEDRTRANLALDQRDRILTRLRDQTTVSRWTAGPLTNAATGAVIGLVVGGAALAWLQLLRSQYVRCAADAASLGTPIMAAIPDAGHREPGRSRQAKEPEAS